MGLNPSGGASMANDKHVAMLKKDVKAWNERRLKNHGLLPDLSGANLSRANLFEADLSGASLINATLIAANLTDAKLTFTQLGGTVFGYMALTEVKELAHCHHLG